MSIDYMQGRMLKAALYYAERGLYLLRAHAPLFDDDGNLAGCSCEIWRMSEKCRVVRPKDYLDFEQGETCASTSNGKNVGKHPKGYWTKESTNDPVTIRQWWGHMESGYHKPSGKTMSFVYNIATDCGKSDLLVLDNDLYKAGGGGASLDYDTVISRTGGGGEHAIFNRAGKPYGNSADKTKLGENIDVRGEGGYILIAPSLHKSGNRYDFVEGRFFGKRLLAPIPPDLDAILAEANADVLIARRHIAAVREKIGNGNLATAPDLDALGLPESTLKLITEGHEDGADRSKAEWGVVCRLVAAGLDDDDIVAIFDEYPIGQAGKYGEKGKQGLVYLTHTIGQARAKVEVQSNADEKVGAAKIDDEKARALVGWAHDPQTGCSELRLSNRRIDGLQKTFGAVVAKLCEQGTPRFLGGARSISDMTGASQPTVSRHLHKLVDAGWLGTELIKGGGYAFWIAPRLLQAVAQNPKSSKCISITVLQLRVMHLDDFGKYVERLSDDAFMDYPYRLAQGRRREEGAAPTLSVLLPSFGYNGLPVWQALELGLQTVREIAEATGIRAAAVSRTLRAMRSAGVAGFSPGDRNARNWHLFNHAEARLNVVRPEMTGYGRFEVTRLKNANARARRAYLSLSVLNDPKARMMAQRRLAEQDEIALTWMQVLRGMKINPKVTAHREARIRSTYDLRELGSVLVGMPNDVLAKKKWLMGLAGWDDREIMAGAEGLARYGRSALLGLESEDLVGAAPVAVAVPVQVPQPSLFEKGMGVLA